MIDSRPFAVFPVLEATNMQNGASTYDPEVLRNGPRARVQNFEMHKHARQFNAVCDVRFSLLFIFCFASFVCFLVLFDYIPVPFFGTSVSFLLHRFACRSVAVCSRPVWDDADANSCPGTRSRQLGTWRPSGRIFGVSRNRIRLVMRG